jgi:hypothetical protein
MHHRCGTQGERNGKADGEGRANSLLALYSDSSFVGFQNALHDGKSETRSNNMSGRLSLYPVEPLKYQGKMIRGDAQVSLSSISREPPLTPSVMFILTPPSV